MRRVALALALALAGEATAQTIADERKALAQAQQEAGAATVRSQRYEMAAAQAMDQADKIRAEAAANGAAGGTQIAACSGSSTRRSP